MTLPKTILVPTDFGAGSDHAIAYAAELAKAFGAEIVIMHAWELPSMGIGDGAVGATTELVTQVQQNAQLGVDRAMQQLTSLNVSTRGFLKQGPSGPAIIECADEVGAGMIVMGTKGRTGVARALLGSVAEKVVRNAHQPVLTIHDPEVTDAAE